MDIRGLFKGIRFKLSVVTFVLIAAITAGSSLIVIGIMDDFLLGELIKRGLSVSMSAATPAGYSILSNDHLALDNLASKIKENQEDILYVAIVDAGGTIRAHSELAERGLPFNGPEGEVVRAGKGYTVKRVVWKGRSSYEFKTPVVFAGNRVGEIYLGIDAGALTLPRKEARRKIFLVSALVLAIGVVGTFFLSTFITRPVKRLTEGVSRLKSGDYAVQIGVGSKDELGRLTEDFNEMARVIMEQRIGLEQHARNLEEAYISIVRILAAAIDARDTHTLGHSTRVARLSLLIGERLGLDEEELKELELACLFHDVGKISLPDRILYKRAPLNSEEYRMMMRHPEHGAEILRFADSLHRYIPAVLYHHEWYNGYGYPEGLKGGEIPLHASIISVADTFDAIISSRPYRVGLPKDHAVEEILRHRGTQFAPYITDCFIDALADHERGRDLSFLRMSPCG